MAWRWASTWKPSCRNAALVNRGCRSVMLYSRARSSRCLQARRSLASAKKGVRGYITFPGLMDGGAHAAVRARPACRAWAPGCSGLLVTDVLPAKTLW